MKTYTKQIEITKPRLEIRNDDNAISPRQDSNLGYFITVDRNYESPDKVSDLQDIIENTGQQANSQAEYIKMIKKQFTVEKVIAIYPVTKYEHSGVSYSLGTKHGFDNSNNGFYIITDRTQKEIGTSKKDFEKVIEQELNDYNKYINGEIYSFTLYDKQGEVIDSCGGFYNINDIKEHLGKEWKNEALLDYLTQ